MKNITIIGAGTMGNGIAHAFAQKEYKVTIVDISNESLEKAIVTITKNLDRMLTKEKISEQEKNDTLANIKTTTDFQAGVENLSLIHI